MNYKCKRDGCPRIVTGRPGWHHCSSLCAEIDGGEGPFARAIKALEDGRMCVVKNKMRVATDKLLEAMEAIVEILAERTSPRP